MKKKMLSAILCVAMTAIMLTGCGEGSNNGSAANGGSTAANGGNTTNNNGTATENETTEGGVYRTLYSSELSTLNYLVTSNANEQGIGANVIDTLVEYNSDGEIQKSLATDWSYDAATLTWTFTIREGATWVDSTGAYVADVTAQDFVDALKYELDPANGCTTLSSVVFGIIANAEEYYNGLAGEEGATPIDFSEVGVKAVDTYTLQYTLTGAVPYFLSMMTYVTYMPAYGPKLDAEGASFGTTAESMLYNGAYYISSYEPQVKLVMTKNESNWDAEHVYIAAIEKIYNADASTIGPEMAKRGEIDYTTLSSDIVDAWLGDAATANMVSMERPAIDYSYFYCFNFNVKKLNDDYYRDGMEGYSMDEKYEPWNWEKAVNNESFRQAIAHAINRVSTMSVATGESVDPSTYIQNTITPAGFAVDSETGKDFTAQAAFADIVATDSYNDTLALSYKEQAMSELAGEVTFPVKVLVKYNPSTTNWEEQSTVLKYQLEAVLGTDFIDVIVEAGPSDSFLSLVRRSSDYMLMLCNWGADYADPETYTDPFYQRQNDDGSYNRGMRYAYLAYAITDNTASAETVKEYFALVEAAKAITDDTDARYAAFAEAESYLIKHALVVPYGTSVSEFVVSKLNAWEGQYAAFGVSALRYKGQHLMTNYYSMSDYEADAAKH